MPKLLQLELDRRAKMPLTEQIRNGIKNAIETGVLASGARLPSWQDLAAQLGVARGSVRSAYEKLAAAQLIVASRATGTHVAARPSIAIRAHQPPDRGSIVEMYREAAARPGIFRMGVPAQETFPPSSSPGLARTRFARNRVRRPCTRTLAASRIFGRK
jgi:GntR family transcriptional regulator / MocR family aminotransferase